MKDKGFCSLIQAPGDDAAAAKKKEALDRETELVKKEYAEKQKKKNEKSDEKSESKDKEKDKEKEKEKEKGKEKSPKDGDSKAPAAAGSPSEAEVSSLIGRSETSC